jgi:hypothetical protein
LAQSQKDDNMNRLVAAILIKAVEDWNDPNLRPDVETFLYSQWFNQLAEMLEMNPQNLRSKLINGDYERLNLRAAYR